MAHDQPELPCRFHSRHVHVPQRSPSAPRSQESSQTVTWSPVLLDWCTSGEGQHGCDLGLPELFELQAQRRRPAGYLSSTQRATGISPSHRASVVDNMTAAAASLGLAAECLHRGVDLLDRLLAVFPTPLHLLQPAAVACLCLGAKFEQLASSSRFAPLILGPSGQPLGDPAAARRLLVLLEQRILQALDWRLAAGVSCQAFADRILQQFARLCQQDQQQQQPSQQPALPGLSGQQLQQLAWLTAYLAELSLLEYHVLPWQPSQLAAACFAYAQVLLGHRLDLGLLWQLSGHSASDELAPVLSYLCALHSTLAAAAALGTPYAVTVKYSGQQAFGAAAVPPISSSSDPRLQGLALDHGRIHSTASRESQAGERDDDELNE